MTLGIHSQFSSHISFLKQTGSKAPGPTHSNGRTARTFFPENSTLRPFSSLVMPSSFSRRQRWEMRRGPGTAIALCLCLEHFAAPRESGFHLCLAFQAFAGLRLPPCCRVSTVFSDFCLQELSSDLYAFIYL